MTVFSRAWDAAYEAVPADTEVRSLGAQRIRNLKIDVHEREAVDHSWAGDADDGLHLQATLLQRSVKPPVAGNQGAVYAKDVSGLNELFFENKNGAEVQLTSIGFLRGVFSGTTYFDTATGQFYASKDSFGKYFINFGANTYIIFDTTDNKFKFTVAGVQVGSFPP